MKIKAPQKRRTEKKNEYRIIFPQGGGGGMEMKSGESGVAKLLKFFLGDCRLDLEFDLQSWSGEGLVSLKGLSVLLYY